MFRQISATQVNKKKILGFTKPTNRFLIKKPNFLACDQSMQPKRMRSSTNNSSESKQKEDKLK
jgi:hypothetical protein